MVSDYKQRLKSIVIPILVVASILLAGATILAVNPGRAHAEDEQQYCSETVQEDCLDPITALVWTKRPPFFPTADCKVYFRFHNPNNVTVPRTITVFLNGEEFFGDDDFLTPGFTPALSQPPLTFGPLSDGEWRIVVSSLGEVFADKTFDFSCGEDQQLSEIHAKFEELL